MGYLPRSGRPQMYPPKYRLNDIDLGYTPQHNGKTFMLKTSHTLLYKLEDIKLTLT